MIMKLCQWQNEPLHFHSCHNCLIRLCFGINHLRIFQKPFREKMVLFSNYYFAHQEHVLDVKAYCYDNINHVQSKYLRIGD